MEATVERIEKNQVVLEVEVEPKRVEDTLHFVYRMVAGRANIPGFRRGRAPRRLVENYFGREYFYNQAIDRLIPEAYAEALEKTKIEPISQPEVELVQMEEGQSLIFKAKVEVKPEVSLGEYMGIEVERHEHQVSEADVDDFLERLRQSHAQLVDLGDRSLEEGDIATISYQGTIDGEAFPGGSSEGINVQVGGPGFVTGFTEQIVGMRIGEDRDIRITFPEDYSKEELAGKEAVFHIHLREGKRRELSDLDDEFAKDVSDFGTLEELQEDISNRLKENAAREADHQVRELVLGQVVEAGSVEVPSSMIEGRMGIMFKDAEIRLSQQGITMEDYFRLTNSKLEDMQEDFRPKAEAAIRRELVLEAVAQKEGLAVEDEELEQEVEAIAAQSNQEVDVVKGRLDQRALDGIKRGLLLEKTSEFLVKNARIGVKEP